MGDDRLRAGKTPRFDVLDVRIDAITTAGAIGVVEEAISSGSKGYVVFCTVSTVLAARDDPAVARAVEEATIVAPDGMPLVWLGRRRGHDLERVYGPDFMIDLISTELRRARHYFFGGSEQVVNDLVERLRARWPDLNVAGFHSPPAGLSASHIAEADVERLNGAAADIIWVALGHPKQELWMAAARPHLDAPLLMGVGAAFDFHSGHKAEAPRWMKVSGLQWLHRLLSEPRRLWRRYLVGNTRFVWLLVTRWFRRRRPGG
ncbi:MAG TPA: WecB/TagA/CpsF family glycosyltransferase [Actinomycetota bacterium]|nr:WecB/TagA/CpsF family glycosyltransferase [Actinomycetota bacterium]